MHSPPSSPRGPREKFDLPPGEQAIFELVSDEPWLGLAAPLGDGRTPIRLNQDHPIASFRLLETVSHEAYPGHHCEAACTGAALTAAKGWSERLSWGYCLPQAVISEGIAELALESLVGSEADEVGAAVLRPLGIPYDPSVAAIVREACEMLKPVRPNLAISLDEQGTSRQDAWDYLRTWRWKRTSTSIGPLPPSSSAIGDPMNPATPKASHCAASSCVAIRLDSRGC